MSSVGEGMVDMGANPTGDHRVVGIKRASANLIDRIEQLEIQQAYDIANPIRQAAMQKVADACALAVQAAEMRWPNFHPASEAGEDAPEGAPV
jgi:hypothetical protein